MDETPDGHDDKDFMEFLNPNSLKIVEAFVEPSLKNSSKGDRFQFQRIGYFNVDDDSTREQLVFNKTVGLRDSWAKQKPAEVKPAAQSQDKPIQQQRKAIDIIQQLGKKYTNLPHDKQLKVKQEIQDLAKNITYDELSPLFATASKKIGTRIATAIALKVLLNNGLSHNKDIDDFINKALHDSDELLVAEAKAL
jgi:glutaminyl-tRNA synthetase